MPLMGCLNVTNVVKRVMLLNPPHQSTVVINCFNFSNKVILLPHLPVFRHMSKICPNDMQGFYVPRQDFRDNPTLRALCHTNKFLVLGPGQSQGQDPPNSNNERCCVLSNPFRDNITLPLFNCLPAIPY